MMLQMPPGKVFPGTMVELSAVGGDGDPADVVGELWSFV